MYIYIDLNFFLKKNKTFRLAKFPISGANSMAYRPTKRDKKILCLLACKPTKKSFVSLHTKQQKETKKSFASLHTKQQKEAKKSFASFLYRKKIKLAEIWASRKKHYTPVTVILGFLLLVRNIMPK